MKVLHQTGSSQDLRPLRFNKTMSSSAGYYEFGPFRFDLAGTRLQRNGQEIGLSSSAKQFLLAIIENKLTGKSYHDRSAIGYFGSKGGWPYLNGKEVAKALGQRDHNGPYLEEFEFGGVGGWDEMLFGAQWTKWFFVADITVVQADGGVSSTDTDAETKNPLQAAPDSKKFDCFVSYASEDRPVVQQIVSALQSRGVSVWWDRGRITLGDVLSKKIDEGLGASRYGLVVVSPTFVGKQWPETELRALHNRAVQSGEKVILPILIELDHAAFARTYPILADIVTATFLGDIESLVGEIVEAIRNDGAKDLGNG
jgi:hypothetical protein